MKTNSMRKNMFGAVSFLIAVVFTISSNHLSAQEKPDKKVVKVKLHAADLSMTDNKDSMCKKTIEVNVNDGKTTVHEKVYEGNKLISEKILEGEEAEAFLNEKGHKSFGEHVHVKSAEGDMINIDVDIDGIEQIDVDKIMKDINHIDIDANQFECDSNIFIWKGDENIDFDKLKVKLKEFENLPESLNIDDLMKQIEGLDLIAIKDAQLKVMMVKDGKVLVNEGEIDSIFMKDVKCNKDGDYQVKKIIYMKKIIRIEDVEDEKIENSLDIENLNIYPNPSDGAFTIEFDNSKNKAIDIKILDVNGQELYNTQIEAKGKIKKTIDSGIAKDGVYIMQISQGNKSYSKKLIVE